MRKHNDEVSFGRSLEERLSNKFDALQLARENQNEDLFDEISKSILVLIKAVPSVFDELMNRKDELDKELQDTLQSIRREASYAKDEIQRQGFIKYENFKAQWDYRELLEEIIMEVLEAHSLIRMVKVPEAILIDVGDDENERC